MTAHNLTTPTLATDGAELHAGLLSDADVEALTRLAEQQLDDRPGVRLSGLAPLDALLSAEGRLGGLARKILGADARPVRAVLFDKSPEVNWIVAWHQDRTIALEARHEMEGFEPWSVKDGTVHVEPPFELIERMLTLRAHIDPCDVDNAPLVIARGSHRWGKAAAGDAARLAQTGERLVCLAEPGDVWAYSTSILHMSERARRPRRRRVLQVDFSAEVLPLPLRWAGV